MFKKTLNKAINYYDKFDYITIVNQDGIIEYSAVYRENNKHFTNEKVTNMHILEVYPSLSKDTSTILKALKTGKEIFNSVQELTDKDNRTYYLLSTDFPIVSDNLTLGVIEVSIELNKEKYIEYLSNNNLHNKKKLFSLEDIITKDKDFIDLKDTIKRVSKTDSTVLVIGETGTGKDMVAQALHIHSYRCNAPFISQNCAAIPATLLESTFFGTIKGAYTGAENTIGLFELANGGTLFLDEINSMDIGLQSKILKAIEEKSIRRVGCNEDRKIDVRIISAMNVEPEVAIKKRKLREDLFYRLSVVRLSIPPLRQRIGDIGLLINCFIDMYNEKMGKSVSGTTDMVRDLLYNHNWVGNVRELQNVIESCFNVLESDIITLQDIPEYIYKDHNIVKDKEEKFVLPMDLEVSLQENMERYEKQLIRNAIDKSDTLAEASRRLKISPQSMQYKINKYKISICRDIKITL